MGISLCMIVKNEERFLADALRSVKGLVDEIIVVDTGSTDKTQQITQKAGAKLFSYTWNNDFSAARNVSLRKATQEWILVLDADEQLAKEDHALIKELITHNDALGYSFLQVSYTDDLHLVGYQQLKETTNYSKGYTGALIIPKIRLFRNRKDIFFEGAVHETVEYAIARIDKEKIFSTLIPIHHYQFAKGEAVLKEKQLHYLQIYESHLQDYPNQAKAYRDIASTYLSFTSETEKALNYFKQSLSLKPHPKTYVGIILCFLKLKNIKDAQTYLRAGLQQFPDDPSLKQLVTALKI